MHPEEFERLFLRRGPKTPAEDADGLRRVRRAASWAVGLGLVAAAAFALWFYLIGLPQLARLAEVFR